MNDFGVAEYIVGFLSGAYLAAMIAYDLAKTRHLRRYQGHR